jgi:ERCC4-type nuclease
MHVIPGGRLMRQIASLLPSERASEILIEHGETRLARRLRSNRYKAALAIAALEGILVLAGAIPWWIVVLLALVSLAG